MDMGCAHPWVGLCWVGLGEENGPTSISDAGTHATAAVQQKKRACRSVAYKTGSVIALNIGQRYESVTYFLYAFVLNTFVFFT